jgi:hypothetical protein
MPTYSLTIPAGETSDWVAAFSENYNPDSGLTQVQWAKREIQRTLNSIVKQYKIRIAAQSVSEPDGTIT